MDSVFRALCLATRTPDSICPSPPSIVLDFALEFFLISRKKRNCLVLALAIHLFGIYPKTIIHLSVGEEW